MTIYKAVIIVNLTWHFDKLHNQQPGEPREHQGEVLQVEIRMQKFRFLGGSGFHSQYLERKKILFQNKSWLHVVFVFFDLLWVEPTKKKCR